MFKPLKTVSGSVDVTADILDVGFISTVTSNGGGSAIKPQLTVLPLNSSGTYTTPANCKYLIVECIGGGGSGGGNGVSTAYAGGGGGGAYYLKQFSPPAASYSWTTGGLTAGCPAGTYADGSTGQTSTFGGMSASGGLGGKKGASSSTPGQCGNGGSTYTGLIDEIIKIDGGTGCPGPIPAAGKHASSGGGSGHSGIGRTTLAQGSGAGLAGLLYGGGAGGSTTEGATAAPDGQYGRISVMAYF